MDSIVYVMEIIGTVAFAVSGAVAAVRSEMDVFGVTMLGIITATAGGIFRDIILGINPPDAFIHPVYVGAAALTSLIVFYGYWYFIRHGMASSLHYKRLLLLGDSIGLAIFTTSGMNTAIRSYGADNGFLIIFSGVLTGVGGGVLRDLMLRQMPVIFRKQIYAMASIIGGLAAWILFQLGWPVAAMFAGSGLIIVIRLMAAHFRWSLPRIQSGGDMK